MLDLQAQLMEKVVEVDNIKSQLTETQQHIAVVSMHACTNAHASHNRHACIHTDNINNLHRPLYNLKKIDLWLLINNKLTVKISVK